MPMATEGETIISVEDVTAAYGDHVVLSGVSFTVRRGEIFAMLGGSGCGKSTLMKQMIGLEHPTQGRVLIEGRDISHADQEMYQSILRSFGVMYQSGALFGSMTILENVSMPLVEFTSLPPEAVTLVARMKLHLVGLSGVDNLMPSELSGGMRKRAAIARAMALDPRILFLDELSAGLDPVTSAELDELVLSLARDLSITFVIVTHELPSIFAVADRAVLLDKRVKGMLALGRPRDLAGSDDPRVSGFFNRRAHDA